MNVYLASKSPSFCVANLRSSPTTTCDWRLESESFRQQSTLSRINQRLLRLYIDARPGGGFYEIFDEQGNGAQHAVVIFAQRGKHLTLRGPLGLSGNALDMVFSFEFKPDAAGTRIVMQARAAGQLEAGWSESVAKVWRHFLIDRLLPYVERDCRIRDVCVKTP